MKRLLIIVFALIANCTLYSHAVASVSNESLFDDEKTIELRRRSKNDKTTRGIGPDVWAYVINTNVYIESFNLNNARVTILNIYGNQVSFASFDSDSSPILTIDLPDNSGQYYIIIESDELYAEGMFVLE